VVRGLCSPNDPDDNGGKANTCGLPEEKDETKINGYRRFVSRSEGVRTPQDQRPWSSRLGVLRWADSVDDDDDDDDVTTGSKQ